MKMRPRIASFAAQTRWLLGSMRRSFEDTAMRWFKKEKPRDIWDEPIEEPIGDIEAAYKIREICRSAASSAEKIGAAADRTHHKIKPEIERYESAVKVAMEIAMKVSDGLLRDAAVRQIIELCLKAGHSKTAQTLFRAIQSKSISQDVLKEHPSLGGG
jgi:dTDP-4-dehydrorhamnose reductase